MSLLSELKRRNVFKVGGAYLSLAFWAQPKFSELMAAYRTNLAAFRKGG